MTDVLHGKNRQRSTGVLLIGHGTRNRKGTSQFFELSEQLQGVLGQIPVQPSLLEFQEPSILQGWMKLAEQGVNHIHVSPLLLFAAGHAKKDIPDTLQECQQLTPHITYDQCRPLSRHANMLELAVQRASAALNEIEERPDQTALVMVGRGSYDPCASADMQILSSLVAHRSNYAEVRTAFYAMTEPKLQDVLECLAQEEAYATIVVQPHLLFEGRLYQAIVKQVEEIASTHPQLQWKITDYLGPNKLVALSIAGRIHQACETGH